MIAKLLRSAIFIKLVTWAAPHIWAYIKKRHAAKRANKQDETSSTSSVNSTGV